MANPNTPAVKTGSALTVFADQIKAIDAFANENQLSVLTEGKGNFEAAIAVADAYNRLEGMLTPELMSPIMNLQGKPIGYKTDQDGKAGYPLEVVRQVFIEATLKGFKMVNNNTNIIAGRFYATKEGFEDWMLRLNRLGKLVDYRETYGLPKFVGEKEAHVVCSASWVYMGVKDSMTDVALSIRVNLGMGADAVLGKAKRKLLKRIFERITGTTINEGEAGDAIDVVTTPAGGGKPVNDPSELSDEMKEKLTAIIAPFESEANAWLRKSGRITEGQTYLNIAPKMANFIIDKPDGFKKSVLEATQTAKA